jgi:putative hydrolase of the HAD superfamily
MLRAVLFDLDNTLVDRNRAFRECVHTSFDDPATRAEIIELDQDGRGDRESFFRVWEKHSGAPMNQSSFGKLLAERLQPDRELIDVLRGLANRRKLGVITNGSSETQRQKLAAAGLTAVFRPDCVWVSADLDVKKPNPAIFLHAVQALGETPADCLFVGDHEHDDIQGATNAGLRARKVDRVLDAAQLEQLLVQEGIA